MVKKRDEYENSPRAYLGKSPLFHIQIDSDAGFEPTTGLLDAACGLIILLGNHKFIIKW